MLLSENEMMDLTGGDTESLFPLDQKPEGPLTCNWTLLIK